MTKQEPLLITPGTVSDELVATGLGQSPVNWKQGDWCCKFWDKAPAIDKVKFDIDCSLGFFALFVLGMYFVQ